MNSITLPTVACAGCGSSNLTRHRRYHYQSKSFKEFFPDLHVLKCCDCGLKQVDHAKLDDQKLSEYYGDHYSDAMMGGSGQFRKIIEDNVPMIARAQFFAKLVERFSDKKEGLKILEIGQDVGYNLRALHDTLPGSQCFGDEINKWIKLPDFIRYGTLDEGPYDVILLSSVFEHFLHPSVLFEKICESVAPGGLIIIQVPNDSDFLLSLKDNDEPHVLFFDVGSMERFLERHLPASFDVLLFGIGGTYYDAKKVKLAAFLRRYLPPIYHFLKSLQGRGAQEGATESGLDQRIAGELRKIEITHNHGEYNLLRMVIRATA